MQTTNQFLKAALQVGPWRVTRRILLFVVAFSLFIIVFGSLILKTHAFDEECDDDDDDDERPLSTGDSLMLVLMGLAGMAGLAACVGCLLATSNTPRPLGENGSVFNLSSINTHQAVAPRPSAPESLTQQSENHDNLSLRTSSIPSFPTKILPQSNGLPHIPDYPGSSGYPTEPPPSYSASSYPAGGLHTNPHTRTIPPGVTRAMSSPPTLLTVADLPPPYAPGHTQSHGH